MPGSGADLLARARAALAEGYCPVEAARLGKAVRLVPTALTDGFPAGWCPGCQVAWHLAGNGEVTFTGTASPGRQAVIPAGCVDYSEAAVVRTELEAGRG
jgi:hypothetical protein